MKNSYEKLLATLVQANWRYVLALAACQDDAPGLFRETRRHLGLTQCQLAGRLGVSNTYLSKIERGHMVAGYPVLIGLGRLMKEEG